jgi:CysZ protein
MKYFRALIAVIHGLKSCLLDSQLRSLAIKPWLIGMVCYLGSAVASYFLHGYLLDRIVGTPDGFWSYLSYLGIWLAIAAMLLVFTLLVSIALIMIFAGVFQTAIARKVLTDHGITVPPEDSGIKGTVKETTRTVITETLKLLWLGPLLIFAALIGIIPFLAPVAIVMASWLLAYQFIDIALDVLRWSALKRAGFSIKNSLLLVCFGLTLTLLWAIPFVGFLIPPAAVAGASWLLAKADVLK